MSASDEFLARENKINEMTAAVLTDLYSVRADLHPVPSLDDLRVDIARVLAEIDLEEVELCMSWMRADPVSRAQQHRYRGALHSVLKRLENEVADLLEQEERVLAGWTP